MKLDELQIGMLLSFFILLVISLYKMYHMFNQPVNGSSIETEHQELRDIIISFIQNKPLLELNNKFIFEALIQEESFDKQRYKSFNQNRFNQLIQGLLYIYKVDSLAELIESIKEEHSAKIK